MEAVTNYFFWRAIYSLVGEQLKRRNTQLLLLQIGAVSCNFTLKAVS